MGCRLLLSVRARCKSNRMFEGGCIIRKALLEIAIGISFNTFFLFFSALDLAANSNVQDAFVIAVEQQARERLERLSALKRIKPVDMTKLSQQVGVSLIFFTKFLLKLPKF